MITAVSVLPDFGWLFVLSSGTLMAFSLGEKDRQVAFVRVGVTKGRVLSELPPSCIRRNPKGLTACCSRPCLPFEKLSPHPPLL
jgi:hypothetical protein